MHRALVRPVGAADAAGGPAACGVARAVILLATLAACGGTMEPVAAQSCAPVPACAPRPCAGPSIQTITIGGSFGNAGLAAASSVQASRAAWGGWCDRTVVTACGPRWCGPCQPWGGWSFGWPGCGIGGWYGRSHCFGSQSVYVAGPGGGFFSGAVVPWATPFWYGGGAANWLPGCAITPFGVVCSPYATLLPPGVGPQFGPGAIFPFFGNVAPLRMAPLAAGTAGRVAQPRAMVAGLATTRARGVRASTEGGRRRSAGQVAAGDRLMREADGDRAKLRAALASYRRAESAERDCPDTFIRQAIVHAALGERTESDAALAKAVALDARLGAPAADVPGDPDPVFGDRRNVGRTVLAARGDAIIESIAADHEPGGDRNLDWLAGVWSARWAAGLDGLAASGR